MKAKNSQKLEKRTPERLSFRYNLTQKLGEGGMGEVWRGWDLWDKKPVALKLLKETKHLEKFKKEFLFLKRLNHPGLVEPFDFNYTREKIPYFTMELVEGIDLSQKHLKKNLKEFYRITIKIAEILEYLHSQGIVHGDLKPENFKLTDDILGVRLLDLGLAEKVRSSGGEKPKGTLCYMAPEILRKQDVDHRADLYSLGIIFYEILTGRLPFEAEDPVHLITLHLERQALPPRDLNDSIPTGLSDLILCLLEKIPEKRIGSARKLKEKLLDLSAKKKSYKEQLLPLFYSSPGEMIGRGKDFSMIKKALKSSVKTKGCVFLLEGELGVGKSTFLKELKLFSQLEGILFLDTRCFENETSPHQPIKEVLVKILPYFENLCPSLLKEHGEELGFVLPGIAKHKTKMVNQNLASSYFKRIAELLIKGSQVTPFAICFDDLHWADEGSLKILDNLMEGIDRGKISLCGSFHRGSLERNANLKMLINKFSGDGKFNLLKLGSLSIREIKSLIRLCFHQKEPPIELVDYVYKSASGNPFFSLEVLKLLLQNKVVFFQQNRFRMDQKGLESFQVPENVEKVWMSNIARLDERTAMLLNLASLLRRGFDLGTIEFLTGFSEGEISEILFFLLKEEFIRQVEKNAGESLWYEFSSPSLKEILYRKISISERKRLHQRVGEYLEKKKGEKEDLAYHFTRAERHQKAYPYSLLCAQDFSNQFAYKQTLYHLKNAIEFSSKFPSGKERSEKQLETLMVRADFWKKTGELNSALGDYQSILDLVQNFPNEKVEAKAFRELGEIYRIKHDYKNGLVSLQRALKVYQKIKDDGGVAKTLNNMANIHWGNAQHETALQTHHQVLEIHSSLGNKNAMALSLNNIGAIYFTLHQYQKALEYFNQALTLQKQMGDQMEVARGLNNLAAVSIHLGNYEKAIRYLLESLELNRKMGNKKEVCFNLENLADVFLRKGEYKRSLKYCQKGLKLSKEIDFTQRSGQILKFMGKDHLRLGEYSKAKKSLEKAYQVAAKIDDKGLKAEILLGQAELFLILNQIKKAEKNLALVKEIIEDIKDERTFIKFSQLEGLIKIKNNEEENGLKCLEQGFKIAEKLSAKEEILQLSLDIWEVYLDLGEVEKTQKFQEISERSLKEIESDAYQPKYFFSLARKNWSEDFGDKAKSFLLRAIAEAEKLEELELLWRLHHLLARWYMELNEYEKAYKELERAGRILKKLSENIKDPELKESHLKDEKKVELLSDVKSIAQMLVGK